MTSTATPSNTPSCGTPPTACATWVPTAQIGSLTAIEGAYTPSQANGINTAGTVVGYAGDTNDPGASYDRAWVWTPTSPGATSGQMTDLNSLIPAGTNWVLHDAEAVNDAGQIVGSGTINGRQHAFLLTPTTAAAQVQATSPTIATNLGRAAPGAGSLALSVMMPVVLAAPPELPLDLVQTQLRPAHRRSDRAPFGPLVADSDGANSVLRLD